MYAVTTGKWYFEFEILSLGPMRVGWAQTDYEPDNILGNDEKSWSFDGFSEEKVYCRSSESFGRQWKIGDVVGVFLDLIDHTISFSLNGELLMDTLGGETAFTEVMGDSFVPAFTLGLGQKAKLCYGQNVNHLKYFTSCGLQEGYEPFCVNMKRDVTHWYTKDQAIFENTEDITSSKIDVTRILAGSDTPPCLKISHNTFETQEKANWEFIRLSLPVICHSTFITEVEKQQRWQEIKSRQQRLMMEQQIQMQMNNPSASSAAISAAHMEHIMKSGFSMSDIKGLQRNYAEDISETTTGKSHKKKLLKSLNRNLHRNFSQYNVTDENDTSFQPQRVNSDINLSRFEDSNSNYLQTKQSDKKKRSKSPFSFFTRKRAVSHDRGKKSQPQRPLMTQVNRNPTIYVTNSDDALQPPLIPARRKSSRTPSTAFLSLSDGQFARSNTEESSSENGLPTEDIFDPESLKLINEYFYGVRIFPGQDPGHVYVGWVTTQYHYHNPKEFNKSKVARSTITFDVNGSLFGIDRQACYMVRADELYNEVRNDASGKGASQGKCLMIKIKLVNL